MQNKWSKIVLQAIVIVMVLLAFLFFVISNRSVINQSISPISNLMIQVDNVFSLPFRWGQSLVDSVNDLLLTYDENKQLKSSLSQLTDQAKQLNELENENRDLRLSLEMKDKLSAPKKISAEVVTRSPLLWWDELMLNVGEDKEVNHTMLAVSDKGLIGKVVEVTKAGSKLILLTKEKEALAIPVKWKNGDKTIYGLLSNYDQKEGTILISDINSMDELKVEGDVVTSGLDGETAADIPVGQLVSVDNKARTAKLKPWADFSNLSVVILVGR